MLHQITGVIRLASASRCVPSIRIITNIRQNIHISNQNYESITNMTPALSLNALINEMKTGTKCTSSIKELESIAADLKQEIIDDDQALHILRDCRNIPDNQDRWKINQSVWIELKAKNCELKPHHYAAIMLCYQKTNDTESMLKIIEELHSNGLHPTSIMFQIMISSYCRKHNIESAIAWMVKLKEAGFHMSGKSLKDVLTCAMMNGDFETAGQMLKELGKYTTSEHFPRLIRFTGYFARRNDLENVIKTFNFLIKENFSVRNNHILYAMHELIANKHFDHVDDLFGYLNPNDITDHFLRTEMTKFIEAGQAKIIPKLLNELNVNINDYMRFLVSEMERMQVPATEISQIIQNARLISTKNDSETNLFSPKSEWKEQAALELRKDRKAVGNHFNSCLKNGNIIEIESMFSNGNIQMTTSRYAELINLYIKAKDLRKALDTFKEARVVDKTFTINQIYLANLVTLMIDMNCEFEEVNELLDLHRFDKPMHRIGVYEMLFQRLATAGDETLLKKVYDSVMKSNSIEETSYSLMPWIAVHLTKGDLQRAVETYEEIVKTKDLTPHTFELMRALIEKKDSNLLQHVYNIYKAARSRSTAQCRLAFAYVECGYNERARAIFESGSITDLSAKIKVRCSLIEKSDDFPAAERLLNVTKGIECNRFQLYRTLLEIYCRKEMYQEALDLWQQFNAEDKPDYHFMNRLYWFLNDNKIRIPDELKVEHGNWRKNYEN